MRFFLIIFSFLLMAPVCQAVTLNESAEQFLSMSRAEFLNQYYEQVIDLQADDEYCLYLRDTYKGFPYTQGYYFNSMLYEYPVKVSIMFAGELPVMVVYQLISDEKLFQQLQASYTDRLGDPLGYDSKKQIIDKMLWRSATMDIVMNFTRKPLGYSFGDNTVSETPFPSLAFTKIPGVDTAKSIELWRKLRNKKILNELGYLNLGVNEGDNPDLNSRLAFLGLDSLGMDMMKVMLLSTFYGELNILVINTPVLQQVLATVPAR